VHTTPAPHSPSLEVLRPEPDVALIVLGGEYDLATAPDLQEAIDVTLASCSHLVVDLTSTEFIDSSIIRLLVSAKRQADAAGRAFNVVLGTAAIVERALEISGALPFLNRVKGLDQAQAAVASASGSIIGSGTGCADVTVS
jgi:anti-sigma B factor antagonist